MKKILFTFLILISFIQFSKSQNTRPNYSLLWKISGNGLSKPSYLFGTMHLRDKRVFDFSDSVLVKLQECESFAMEVTPDSSIARLFDYLELDKKDTVDHLRKELSSEEYKALDEKLKSEVGIHISQLKDKSPKAINKLFSMPLYKKGEKNTFLDAYLYRVALSNDKKIIGLENIEDQAFLLKSSSSDEVDQLKEIISNRTGQFTMEDMIKLYWQGDINKIAEVNFGSDTVFLDKLFRQRNIKMADSIEKLSKVSATFVAVGAGHLPGNTGIIELLRKKGFTVTKVQASFTGLAAKYKEKPIDVTWYNFKLDQHYFTLQFPSKPVQYKGSITPGSIFYVYPDLGTGLFYYSISTNLGPAGNSNMDELFKRIAKNMSSKAGMQLVSQKLITYQEYPACDYVFYNQPQRMTIKTRIVTRSGCMYILMVGSFDKSLLSSNDSEHFFKSLQFTAFEKPEWKTFVSKEGGFEVNTPVQMEPITLNADNENGETLMFNAADQVNGIAYFSFYVIPKAGTYYPNDSLLLSTLIESMKDRGKLESTSDIMCKGYPGKTFIAATKDNYYIKGRYILRGNRPYGFFAISSKEKIKEKESDVNAFLESVNFIEFQPIQWQDYTNKKYNFTISVPSKVSIDTDSSQYFYNKTFSDLYQFQNKSSNDPFIVSVINYSPYYKTTEKELYEEFYKSYIESTDSTLSVKDITSNGIKGKEVIYGDPNSNIAARMRYFPKGENIFCLFAYTLKSDTSSRDVNKFFESLKFKGQIAPTTLFESKSKLLFKDLLSADSVTFAEAKKALRTYKFTSEDLPLLYEAINKSYQDDTSDFNARYYLLLSLEEVNDKKTVPFIKENYGKLKDREKLEALQALLYIKTDESKKTLIELTDKSIPEVEYIPYNFFSPLWDSLEYRIEMFPKLFFLTKNEAFRDAIYRLGISLLDSNKITIDFFTPYKSAILDSCKAAIEKSGNGTDENDYYNPVIQDLELLSRMKGDTAISNYLQRLTTNKNNYLAFDATIALIKRGENVNAKTLERFASQMQFRKELYDELKKQKRESLFPSKWLKQELFAQGEMYRYLSYDEEFDGKLVLVKKKKMMVNNEIKMVYLYKISYSGNDTSYPGICGPFSIDPKDVTTNNDVTTCDWESFKIRSADDHISYLIKRAEEYKLK